MNEKMVLLWSHSQCAFHIERLEEMLTANMRAFKEDRPMDYATLFVGTEDDCDRMADVLRPTLRKRQQAKALADDAINAARWA